jgi:hypothetical protein
MPHNRQSARGADQRPPPRPEPPRPSPQGSGTGRTSPPPGLHRPPQEPLEGPERREGWRGRCPGWCVRPQRRAWCSHPPGWAFLAEKHLSRHSATALTAPSGAAPCGAWGHATNGHGVTTPRGRQQPCEHRHRGRGVLAQGRPLAPAGARPILPDQAPRRTGPCAHRLPAPAPCGTGIRPLARLDLGAFPSPGFAWLREPLCARGAAGRLRLPVRDGSGLTGRASPETHTRIRTTCSGSLSICDSIARTAVFAFADGGRIQRRLARTADPKLSQRKVSISPSKFLRNLET